MSGNFEAQCGQAEVTVTYFEDLSPYSYLEAEKSGLPIVNVGWLDSDHEYLVGNVAEDVISSLAFLCEHALVNHTRGFHQCPFCEDFSVGPTMEFISEKEFQLGTAEIRVSGINKIYAAPNLILHYVLKHGYSPPHEFQDAVLSSARDGLPPIGGQL